MTTTAEPVGSAKAPPGAPPPHAHPGMVGVFAALIVFISIFALIAVLVVQADTDDASSAADLRLTPKSELPVVQAAEGTHWTHAPAVPPAIARSGQAALVVDWKVSEFVGDLDAANKVRYAYWGFEGSSPGPLLRVRQGDLVRINLTNDSGNTHPHNIDFHFVTGPGGGASALNVAPGKTASVEVRALQPGIYMYHCATPDIPTHIANGMYGFVIVEPQGGLPAVDRELYVVQSEFYPLRKGSGPATLDVAKLDLEEPDYVVFNGAVGSLMGDKAPTVGVGERVRIWIGNGGPQLVSSFHVIGEIFDVVYREGDLVSAPARGVQTTIVPAGGAAAVELTIDVPGTYLLVDHAIARTLHKGALGALVAEGADNPEVFAVPEGSAPPPADDGHGNGSGSGAEAAAVEITKDAWDQKNAARAFDPLEITVAAGTTVTWTNADPVAHTVTADDATFDSGFLEFEKSFSHTFQRAGTYTYYCMPHPWMKGTVTVT